jgi:O-antigen ligase
VLTKNITHWSLGLTCSAALSFVAGVLLMLSMLAILVSYLYGLSLPERWPSLIYFYAAFVMTVTSKKWGTVFLIFMMPLLPNLHIQLEYLRPPVLKSFIAYPGLDFIVGYVSATCLHLLVDHKSFRGSNSRIPWPLAASLIFIACSASIAIARNLAQSGSDFSLAKLLIHLLSFKILDWKNDYFPLADLLVYSSALALVVTLLPLLRTHTDRDQLVFKPLLAGLFVSASWGIFQALTGFGLPITTSQYRTEDFGFGAHGFQPDLHAFAAHMLVGAVGLYAYLLKSTQTTQQRWVAGAVCIVCWVALVLSKSRASVIFAVVFSLIFLLHYVWGRKWKLSALHASALCFAAFVLAGFTFFHTGGWLLELFNNLKDLGQSDFDQLNRISKWRLELHLAATRMWSAFPIFGLGQGTFFRLSSLAEFSQSPLMVSSGGENAHNYFLQTLAELGVLGFSLFCCVFIWPLRQRQNWQGALPVCILILATFLGNLYSHAFIIRENLFLLAVFVALLYSQTEGSQPVASSSSMRNYLQLVYALAIISLLAYGFYEVIDSFGRYPFECRNTIKCH